MYDHFRFINGLEPERIEGPFKVYQRDRLIGTVPAFPVRSTSGIFDVRPGDFRLGERDSEKVVEAGPVIGPGDFEVLEGFTRADGQPIDRSFADQFDVLAKMGAGRAAAIGAVIEDALSNPRKNP